MFRPSPLALILVLLVGTSAGLAASGQPSPAAPSSTCSAYESIPLPTEADIVPLPKAPPSCASYRSYRGLGRPVHFAQARACAWQERAAQMANLGQNPQEPTAWIVGGSLILADLYANGAGVPRNLPLAMRLACEAEEGMAKLASPELPWLPASSRTNNPFEFCHYAASTITMNFCAAYATEVEDDRKARAYRTLQSSMPADQAAAFARLLTAQHAYIKAHALEVDQGGTIRAVRTMGSQAILEDLFRTDLNRFEHKLWPTLSAARIATAETSLQRTLASKLIQLHQHTSNELQSGSVSAENLTKVERSWDAYREAWTAFARLRYPAAAEAIRAKITLDRVRLLKTID